MRSREGAREDAKTRNEVPQPRAPTAPSWCARRALSALTYSSFQRTEMLIASACPLLLRSPRILAPRVPPLTPHSSTTSLAGLPQRQKLNIRALQGSLDYHTLKD